MADETLETSPGSCKIMSLLKSHGLLHTCSSMHASFSSGAHDATVRRHPDIPNWRGTIGSW